MKKMIIVLLVAIVPAKAYNQISQGSVIVGGEFSLELSKNKTEQDNNTDDGPTRTNFRIMPDVEYFLAENLSAGLGLGYTLSKTTTEATNSETTRKNGTFVIMPYLKKYFTLGERAYFYGQALAAFGFGDETTEVRAGSVTTSIEENSNSIRVGIVPGFRYDITDRLGLEAGIGFLGFNRDVDKSGSGNNEEKEIDSTFELSFLPNSFSLGIRYTLQ